MADVKFCEAWTEDYSHYIWSVALSGHVISLFGSSFMLSSFFRYGSGRGYSYLVAFLAFSDYLGSLSVLVSMAYLLYFKDTTMTACVLFRGLFQIFSGSTVVWTAIIAFYVYIVIFNHCTHFRETTPFWVVSHIIGWGFHTIFFVVTLIIPESIKKTDFGICFPVEPWHIALWLAPNMALFAFVLVVYVVMLVKIRRDRVLQIATRSFGVIKRVSLYLLVFLVCWAIEWVAYFIALFLPCIPWWLTIIYGFLPTLQGLLDALVYGLTNTELKQHYKEISKFKLVLLIIQSPFTIWFYDIWLFLSPKNRDLNGNSHGSMDESDSRSAFSAKTPLIQDQSSNF
eukprot:TRINITY_DN6256_c0_g1_i1.p1 TRINITY_DN6256_c0_g1~~TRINITY_DN6256_c0_g1_i1.p1  ORF type:complete len:341 (+),score=13.97 TRINITY_DN6256_c0_g1_i1:31-1053(+)